MATTPKRARPQQAQTAEPAPQQTTAIAHREETAAVGFEPRSLAEAEHLAVTLSKSSIIPKALQGRPADVLVTLLTGRELGLGPMQSLRGIYVVNGRGVTSADLIVALVKRSPVCEWFRLVESTDKVATYETKRVGEQPTTMSISIEQAQRAGLVDKDNWKLYPAAMLRARCSAALDRAVYPDLAMGIYDHDELADGNQGEPRRQQQERTQARSAPARAEVADAELVHEPAADPDAIAADWVERIHGAVDETGLRILGEAVAREVTDQQARAQIRAAYEARLAELREASR